MRPYFWTFHHMAHQADSDEAAFEASWVSLGTCRWIGVVGHCPCGKQQLHLSRVPIYEVLNHLWMSKHYFYCVPLTVCRCMASQGKQTYSHTAVVPLFHFLIHLHTLQKNRCYFMLLFLFLPWLFCCPIYIPIELYTGPKKRAKYSMG